MAKDPNGFISFDKDGVLRSFDGNNQVIGYYPLNPTQISNMIAALPGDYDKTAMTEQFAGVDGTKVTGETPRSFTSVAKSLTNSIDKTQLLTPAADITSGAADVSVNKRAEVKARLEDRYVYSLHLFLPAITRRAEINHTFPIQPREEGRLHAPKLRSPQRLPWRVRPRLHPRSDQQLRRPLLRQL